MLATLILRPSSTLTVSCLGAREFGTSRRDYKP
jgi:hypothetical protein